MVGFVRFVDKLSLWVGHCFAWCIMILIFGDQLRGVRALRPAARRPAGPSTSRYMMYGALFMMAGAYTLSRDGHVRADMLYRSCRRGRRPGSSSSLYILFFFPGVLALIYVGIGLRGAVVALSARSASTARPTSRSIRCKTLIPIAGLFLLPAGHRRGAAAASMCLRDGRWPRRLHDVEEIETAILHVHEDEARVAGGRPVR